MTDLKISIFDYAKELSKKRSFQKERYSSCKKLSEDYELLGILGELIYGAYTGELFDSRLRTRGDDGFDFDKRVDVKTSEYRKGKHLIEYLDKDFSTVDYYVYVLVNLEEKIGEVYGWISMYDFVKKAKEVDFGYGKRYALNKEELNRFKIQSLSC